MSPRQPTRPTAVLLGAMSLLGRCRALSTATATAVVRSSTARVTRATMTATARISSTSLGVRRYHAGGFVSAPVTGRRAVPSPLLLSRMRSTMSGSSRQRPSPSKRQRGGALSFDNNEEVSPCDPSIGHGRVGMSSMPSGRRRRTALGMVSDRPFRGPQAEALEHMDFTTLGLLDDLVDSMAEFGFESPSKIQRTAIPQILNGGNLVFAAATGSGKTLAYLMPLIQQLRAEEAQAVDDESEPARCLQRPRALVLVPTRELAVQVLEVAKRLSRVCKFSSCGIIGGEDYGKQRKRLAGTVDIVVATPGRLQKHQEQGNFFMSKVRHVVVDEVDTMLTQGFAADIEKLTRPMLANPQRRESAQFVFVTATLTKAVRKLLEEGNYPKVRMVETRDVHHSLPTMRHVMIDIKGRDKMSCLIDVAQQHHKDFTRTLVFCNTVKSCRAAEFGLREVDIPTLSYHGEVPSDERTRNLDRFKAGDVKYLVCTDIAARGLDMPDVNHVIMFDFPLNPIDYLHRSGRTARMGASGRVTSLLAKRDLVLAAAIEQAVQSGMPLDELSSRRTDYATGARLGPLFGRKGAVITRGNNHALKAVANTRARGPVNATGQRVGQPRKRAMPELASSGGRGRGGGGRKSGGRGGRGAGGRSGGPGRARKYN